MSRRLLPTLTLLTAAAGAQDLPLIGFTANNAGSLISEQEICQTPTRRCVNALPPPVEDWAGGLAYSPLRDSVWHTQGTRLQELLLDAACTPSCSRDAVRILGTDSRASGLAMDVGRRRLYQLETVAGRGAIVTYDLVNANPCPNPIDRCDFVLPTTRHHAGGIALDAQRDVVYVATSIFGAADPQTFLYVFRVGSFCQPFCRLQVTSCLTGPLQAVRAATYDECHDHIYLSDGRQTSIQRVIWSSTGCPVARPVSCCVLNHPLGQVWCGFDLRSKPATQQGFSCTSRPCPSCPGMALSPWGIPAVGNSQFNLLVENAPAGGTAFLFIGAGPCQPGIPFLCGRFHVNLAPPPVMVAAPLLGVGVCDGAARFQLPIPNSFGLCGGQVCAQAIIVCPNGGFGLTNAVEITVGS